jgi:hypothetical protein
MGLICRYSGWIRFSFASGLLGIFLFIFFNFFPSKVNAFQLGTWGYVTVISACILIPYLLSGIWYLLDELNYSLARIKFDSTCDRNSEVMLLMKMLRRPWLYAGTIVLIMASFFILDVLHAPEMDLFFFSSFPSGDWNSWYARLDMYIFIIRHTVNLLIANLAWLVINIACIFYSLAKIYRHQISIDILDADGFAGLGYLKDLILKTGLIYMSSLSLAIVSYASPSNSIFLICYENFLYLLLILVGIGFFIICLKSLNIIKEDRLKVYIIILATSYSSLLSQLKDISNTNDGNKTNKEIANISIALNALNEERERLIKIGGYDYLSIVTFVCSLIIPIASKVLVNYAATLITGVD